MRSAIEIERDHRRLFLWTPVALGTGIVLYFVADREPALPLVSLLAIVFAGAGASVRSVQAFRSVLLGMAAVFAGMALAGWRTASVMAPVLDHMQVASLQGYIEEMDFRREGARFILRVAASDDLDPARTPFRVRLTTRHTPAFEAGSFVQLKARLLPPSRAAAPGAYDFARDAFFQRIGAVGNVLGRIDEAVAPDPPGLSLTIAAAIDRARNALARRVDHVIGGDAGAIAAAMVTGKRDLLSDNARTLIREAGIYHVVTISGVQMTLVAAIFFVGLRRLLALSTTLALGYPIKKWAAAAALAAAGGYDLMTGSRVGTERALVMTVILLSAVLLDRQALTMRNLALAALAVLFLQPEALLGASFQLSFAAVAAIIAVQEHRVAEMARSDSELKMPTREIPHRWFGRRKSHGLRGAILLTLCATAATAGFMACDFHEVNPYVVVGNPLTLAIIEFFAVPGALLGTLLFPLGLDALVWHWVGFGISIVLTAARFIGSLPGSTLHLPTFAPWSLAFFALAVLSAVIWRTTLLRATAVPFFLIGLIGSASGPTVDIAIAGTGNEVAVRQADHRLVVIGRRPSAFDAEQWLRGDADGRDARAAIRPSACDALGCVARLADGRAVALVLQVEAFAEDCRRAAVVVTPLFAPDGCAATVFDRKSLSRSGAVTLKAETSGFRVTSARAADEDRPWSPLPHQAAKAPAHEVPMRTEAGELSSDE